jgi:N6-L-threonylcarbamoyladenine synthase
VVDETGVLSDVVYSQTVHAAYGGVVPELAARAHIEKLGVVVETALSEAGIEQPDAVAATAGPGLIGAVLVGLSWGKGLAAGWGCPFVGVNHLEGHMLSVLLEAEAPEWPFLALVVSGGHTTLYACEGLGAYTVLGETVDDAAGEAFDKVARMLGLGYPGGPLVDRCAAMGRPDAVPFPRPLPRSGPHPLDFSFSGLKTAVRNHLQKADRADDADVCASFQAAVVDCLLKRVRQASEQTGLTRLTVAGGVAANSELRRRAAAELGLEVFLPRRERCTDNAAMIANVGRLRLLAGQRDPLNCTARPVWGVT